METIICEKGTKITSPQEVYNILKAFEKEEKEMFFVFYLDSRNRVNNAEIEFIGTWDRQLIDCKPILKKALMNNSTNVIVAHNHPSGCNEPSSCDVATTEKLEKAFDLVDIELHDHIVFSKNGYYSFKSEGNL